MAEKQAGSEGAAVKKGNRISIPTLNQPIIEQRRASIILTQEEDASKKILRNLKDKKGNEAVPITMSTYARQMSGGIPMSTTLEKKRHKRRKTEDSQEEVTRTEGSSSTTTTGENVEGEGNSDTSRIQTLAQISTSTPTLQETNFAPQVQIVDGKIVLDEQSLTIQVEKKPEYNEDIIVENFQHITSASYSNHPKTDKWTVEDTNKFYDGLGYWGTDFELISKMFKKRDRRQIKNKFKKEEKLNPQKVTAALMKRRPAPPSFYQFLEENMASKETSKTS